MPPTTKDLAKAAGVSLATVDRVLNGRAGVRKDTVDAVNEAIEKIGFVRNMAAANLARSRTYRFDFLLPRHGDQFLEALIERIAEARDSVISEQIHLHHRQVLDTDPHQIARIIAGQDPDKVDGVAIMAPESPQVRDAIQRLTAKGVQVVKFISGQSGGQAFDFVGIDNRAAGATAARLLGRFAGGAHGKVLVISETMQSRDSLERRLGFDGILTRDFPALDVLPSLETYGDATRAAAVAHNAFASHPDILGAYILSAEARAPLAALGAVTDLRSQIVIAHERTRFTEQALISGDLDAVIAQDPGHLVRSAIRLLRARNDARQPLASQEQIRIEILIRENLGR